MRRLLIAAFCTALLGAAETAPAIKPIQVGNTRIEPSEAALNQPVRLDFTTMPRQVDGIDIGTAVTNALMLAGGEDWRILGKPSVDELGSKSKAVRVVVTLLPRRSGTRPVPDIPITWLQGNYVAHVDPVRVLDRIQVAGTLREPPKETAGIADWKWGMTFAEAEGRTTPGQIEKAADRIRVKAGDGLVLDFVEQRLAQATLTVPDLDLEGGRIGFLERWGLPIDEAQGQMRWIIGWTVITAAPGEGGKGVVLTFQREDILGELAKTLVKTRVFNILDRK